jgi:hypothetical protein
MLAIAPQIRLPQRPGGRSRAPEQALRRWFTLGLRCIARTNATPPRAARGLALLSIGLHAAQRNERDEVGAALAGAAVPLLRASFPLAQTMGLISDPGAPGSPAARRAYGRGSATADALLTRAATDGALEAPAFETPSALPAAPGAWEPTPHKYMAGIQPTWGMIQPLVLQRGEDARVPPPPAWTSRQFDDIRQQFAAAQQRRAEDRALASRWAYGAGTVTPIGAWFEIAFDLIAQADMPLPDAAETMALLGITLHDACIACWESKYHYRLARPVQWMPHVEPNWAPLLETPPHPSYPSGHATFSGAAASILGAIFPNQAQLLHDMASEAAFSRIVAGIHWPIDSDAGLQQGRMTARLTQRGAAKLLDATLAE